MIPVVINTVNSAETFVRNSLPGLLDTLYAKIKSDAPNAKVIIVGYPEFYQVPGSCSVGLSNTGAPRSTAALICSTPRPGPEAGKYGFTFDDVRNAFSAHEICSSSSWIDSVEFNDVTESYHPKAARLRDADLPCLDASHRLIATGGKIRRAGRAIARPGRPCPSRDGRNSTGRRG